ncbi:MAG: hypothetical protein JST92_02110 [Deltaproteobacteria bacterium]|nr:hypothetical protein [Deltaproteobacteria bacterium]
MLRASAMVTAAALSWAAAGCAEARDVTRPQSGKLSLRCADGEAEVRIDGLSRGRAADFDGKHGHLYLKPGPHRIELQAKSGLTETREVELGPGDDVTMTISLPQPGGVGDSR